jgi:hypothetical protein
MAALATFGQSVLNAELDAIQDAGTKLGLCKNFLRSDDYATTNGKVIASVVIDAANSGSNLFWGAREDAISGATDDGDAPSRRQLCAAVQLDAATGTADGAGDDLSLVILSGSEVLAVTDETTDRVVVALDEITTFAFYLQATQPVTA